MGFVVLNYILSFGNSIIQFVLFKILRFNLDLILPFVFAKIQWWQLLWYLICDDVVFPCLLILITIFVFRSFTTFP